MGVVDEQTGYFPAMALALADHSSPLVEAPFLDL